MFQTWKKNTSLLACLLGSTITVQQAVAQLSYPTLRPMETAIQRKPGGFFYVDLKNYPTKNPRLPIGVFDSGTGGLTILDALLGSDRFNNETGEPAKDGLPDFGKEQFIYLADQANMPYGNYFSEKKSDLLVEHVLKDVQFLLSDKYYASSENKNWRSDKQPVKAIVVACNTATAYGIDYIREFLRKAGLPLKVIGVIDAGAKGLIESLDPTQDASVAVFATVGTVASGGYEKTIRALKARQKGKGRLEIFNQGGYGLAEAVDEEPDFLNRAATAPQSSYRGPSLDNATYRIDKTLMDIYRFDFDRNKMLCDSRNTDDCSILQLNATDNYIRYHLVSLMEQIRKKPGSPPLKAIVLGCTHYPYLVKDIRQTLSDLYNYEKNGQYPYRALMDKEVKLIDPADNVVKELHAFLKEQHLFNPSGQQDSSQFYITVPNTDNPDVVTDSAGRFTYAYKYGRKAGEVQEYVKTVPFDARNIPAQTYRRFEALIPRTAALIRTYQQGLAWEKALLKTDTIFKTFAAKQHYPSIVYAIVKDGKLIHSGSTGYSNLEKKYPTDSTVSYRIASMTKSFVSVAILRLRDEGKLRLDDPVSMYIPEIAGQTANTKDAPAITIRHLLTHAAGFPEDNPWGDRQLAISDSAMLQMLSHGISFSTTPGTAYEYSNMGFAMLGYIVGKLSGSSYNDYINRNVLQPLGMTETYWEYEKVPERQLAIGYRWHNGSWEKQPMLHDGAYGAMGGMISSLRDFVKYMSWQLNAWPPRDDPDRGPIKRSSVREMQHAANFNTLVSGSGSNPCAVATAYGYGLRWSRDCKGRVMVGHSGGLPGFGSNWTILPDYGIGIVSFSNHTYASASYLNQVVLDTLLQLTGMRPRKVPVSDILAQRQQELLNILPSWDTTGRAAIFAINFFDDYFLDELRTEAMSIFEKAGTIPRTGEMQAENQLRGKCILYGTNHPVEISFTLSPEQPARIQEYHIRALPPMP